MNEHAARCLAHGPEDGVNPTAIPGLSVYRKNAVSEPLNAVYNPSIFLVTQGRRQALVGDDVFAYDPANYLVTSVPMPVVSQILEATHERPFLSLVVEFDLAEVRELMGLAGDVLAPHASEPPQRGLAACPVTAEVRDITSRLLDLMDRPEDVKVLGPLHLRELLYQVLKGPRGGFLRAVAMGHGRPHAIAEVLTAIHADCTQTFTVDGLASMAGVSKSVFHEAFKAVTASTPQQYVKRLRLLEAHRQLTQGLTNVSGAAYGVGYNSLSQFTREFTRVFGANPSTYLLRP